MKEQILERLKSNYNYKGINESVPLEGLFLNKTYRVGDDFFVKLSETGKLQSDSHYAAKLALVRAMGEHDLPVPHLVPTINGDNFAVVRGYNMEVHRWIPDCEHFTGCVGQIEQVAQGMAHYHTFFDFLNVPAVEVVKSLSGNFAGMAERGNKPFLEELTEYEMRLSSVSEPLRSFLVRALPLMREHYQDLQYNPSVMFGQGLDQGIIHADLHDLQILFDQHTKELQAFVDWEGACVGTRAFDIGYTMERLSTDTNLLYNDALIFISELTHHPQKVTAFMNAYLQKRSLSTIDINSIVDTLILECLNRNAKWLRDIFPENQNSIEVPTKYPIYFRIMSIERMEELRKHLKNG